MSRSKTRAAPVRQITVIINPTGTDSHKCIFGILYSYKGLFCFNRLAPLMTSASTFRARRGHAIAVDGVQDCTRRSHQFESHCTLVRVRSISKRNVIDVAGFRHTGHRRVILRFYVEDAECLVCAFRVPIHSGVGEELQAELVVTQIVTSPQIAVACLIV